MRYVTAAVLLALMASGAAADEFRLVNGRTIEGIERPDPARPDRVVIEVGAGVIELDAKDVLSKSPGRTVLHEYYERWNGVKNSGKAADFYQLARWAKDNRCPKFVLALCERAVSIDPDHAGARAALGHQRVGGKWMTFEEAQAAKGLVLFEGRWVTAAERELVEKERLEAKERALAAQKERERLREEERQRKLQAVQEYNDWLARESQLPYGYFHRPSWFWPAYYRPYPWIPYQYKRPPCGVFGPAWGGSSVPAWGACWDAVPTFDVTRFIGYPFHR